MKLHATLGAVAAMAAFALGFVPVATAVTLYILVGATAGVLSDRALNWVRAGLGAVIGAAVVGVLINETLPTAINRVSKDLDPLEVGLLTLLPWILKTGLLWGALEILAHKLRRTGIFG